MVIPVSVCGGRLIIAPTNVYSVCVGTPLCGRPMAYALFKGFRATTQGCPCSSPVTPSSVCRARCPHRADPSSIASRILDSKPNEMGLNRKGRKAYWSGYSPQANAAERSLRGRREDAVTRSLQKPRQVGHDNQLRQALKVFFSSRSG